MGTSLNTNLIPHVTQTANGEDKAREIVLAAQVAGSGARSDQKINQTAGDESVTSVDDKTGAISRIKPRALHGTHCTASSMTRWVRPGARGLL
jgi:hypothetical protein